LIVLVGFGRVFRRRGVADIDIAIGGSFDAAGTELTVGVAVTEQRQHHVRRKLLIAATRVVDGKDAQGQALDGSDDEARQIVLSHPVAQFGRQQQRNVAVGVLEAVCDDTESTAPAMPLLT
jgi:hypothetical protein